jgi:hypothetical protein
MRDPSLINTTSKYIVFRLTEVPEINCIKIHDTLEINHPNCVVFLKRKGLMMAYVKPKLVAKIKFKKSC